MIKKKNKQGKSAQSHSSSEEKKKERDASPLLPPAPKQPAWRSLHSCTPAQSIAPMMCPRACFLRVRHAHLRTGLPVQRHWGCASAEPERDKTGPRWDFVVRTSLPLSHSLSLAPSFPLSLSCTCSDPRSANGRRLRPGCRRETRRAAQRSCLHTHSGLAPPRR